MIKAFRYSIWVLALLFTSCSPWWENETFEEQVGIRFQTCIESVTASTRANIYEDAVAMRHQDIYVYAFLNDKNYFESNLKWLDLDRENIHEWRFFDAGSGTYVEYFWPIEETAKVDFFAYYPSTAKDKKVDASTPLVIFNATQKSFTCQVPLSNISESGYVNQDDNVEFMCAYTPDKVKTQEAVTLQFKHPFAAIYFEVKQARRNLTIKNIGIKNLYTSGTGSINSEGSVITWSNQGNLNTINVSVDKTIPTDINFGGLISSDPLNPRAMLVIPQILNESGDNAQTLFIDYEWDNNDNIDNNDTYHKEAVLRLANQTEWQPGYRYTYILDLGNMREEILFQVRVEPWEFVFDHEIEIE